MGRIIALILILVSAARAGDVRTANKATARRIFAEILTQGKFEEATQLYAPDFVNHTRTYDASLAEDQKAARGWREASPDLVFQPEILVAENDLVAVVWRGSGTNTGTGNGLPATGRHAEVRGITIWRFADGKVKEEWSEFSYLLLLQQLGLLPGGPAVESGRAAFVPERTVGTAPPEECERNRAIVSSVFEQALGQGKLDLFGSIYAKDFTNHGIHREGSVQGEIDATKGARQMAPDLKMTIVKSIAEGDLVAVMYMAEGTNTGEGLGFPATGKHFKVRGISVMRVEGGLIRDEWSVLDYYQVMEQLGLLSK